MGSNVIGQINIIIKKMFIFHICWESFAGERLKSELVDISRDWVFFFVMFVRSLLQLTSVVVCLWLFLSLVLSSASEMLLNQVEIRRLTRLVQNIPLFYLQKLLGCFCSMFWVIVHLYYEAPSNQLCCIWLNLGREYISIHFRIEVFCLIITKHQWPRATEDMQLMITLIHVSQMMLYALDHEQSCQVRLLYVRDLLYVRKSWVVGCSFVWAYFKKYGCLLGKSNKQLCFFTLMFAVFSNALFDTLSAHS